MPRMGKGTTKAWNCYVFGRRVRGKSHGQYTLSCHMSLWDFAAWEAYNWNLLFQSFLLLRRMAREQVCQFLQPPATTQVLSELEWEKICKERRLLKKKMKCDVDPRYTNKRNVYGYFSQYSIQLILIHSNSDGLYKQEFFKVNNAIISIIILNLYHVLPLGNFSVSYNMAITLRNISLQW